MKEFSIKLHTKPTPLEEKQLRRHMGMFGQKCKECHRIFDPIYDGIDTKSYICGECRSKVKL